VLSWLAPEPVPLSLFESKHLAASVPEPRDVLADLAGYSLVRFAEGDDAVKVHRLVQEITRSRTSEPERGPTLQLALETVNGLAPLEAYDVRTWPVWTPLSPHATSVIGHADAAGISRPSARLMNQLGLYLKTRGQFPSAEPLYQRALVIDEQSFGPEHPDVARDLNNLALLLQATNRVGEAEPLMRRALEILVTFRRQTGYEHPNTLVVVENYRGLLTEVGRSPEQIEEELRSLIQSPQQP
jgi:hypothetical protein